MKCQGIEIRPLEYSGCAGGTDCPTCKGTGEMQLCGHTVLVQDPNDERMMWRWQCQRLAGHPEKHMGTNSIRVFVWRDEDEVIQVGGAESQRDANVQIEARRE